MELSIQGKNKGTISELYTRYSFSAGVKFEEGRHQICVHDKEDYGVFKGIANVELICENNMILHILPSEEDFDTVYQDIEVDYLDQNFKKQHRKYSGWTAQIIQHEIDHCNGVVI